MKKYIFLICTVFLINGCSLDEPHYGKTTTDVFYTKESGIRDALTGAYLQLRETWNEYALNHYFIGDCTTDDALKGSTDGDRGEVFQMVIFNVEPTNGEVGRRWEIAYRLVNRSNDVIYYAPDAEGDPDMLERYANEAKVLRAFGYYILVTSFGDVPLMTQPLTPTEIMQMKRAPKEEVYAQMEADLKEAAAALPSKNEYATADQYRVTRGLAKTIMAKMYMFRGMYPEAEAILKEIVETDQDYSLLPDYGMNWRREYVNSSESIFELPNAMYDKTIGTGTNVPHFFTTKLGTGYSGYGFHVPTIDLYNAYTPDDPRITYVFTQTGDRYIGDTQEQNNEDSETGFHDYKMTVPRIEKEGYDVWMIPYNIRLIRYSDVLLLYAEALNENGKGGQALTYLNMVRDRARNTNPVDPRKDEQAYIPPTTANSLPPVTTTDKDQLRQAIWQERRLELAMEGWRRDDLIRQKRFGQVMRAYAAKYKPANYEGLFKGENFNDSKDYLLPIPQGERDKSQGNLTQNPMY